MKSLKILIVAVLSLSLTSISLGRIASHKVSPNKIHTNIGYKTAQKTVAASPKDIVQNLSPIVSQEPSQTIGTSNIMGQGTQENNARFSRVSDASNPSRFQMIKVNAETASDEINFWVRQMSEHALFNYLGLEDPNLKQESLDLHTSLEGFRKKFNNNPFDLKLMDTVLPLLEKERKFQIKVLSMMDEGKWVGWIFPLFENHITLELDYLVDKLNGIKYSAQDEVLFWNRINSEHAAFAAHLLDPSERDLFLKADQMSEKFYNIPASEKDMMMRISLQYSEQLDEFNKTAQSNAKTIKSVIHPVLLEHVIREGERSIKTLKSLGLHVESSKFEQQYNDQILQYTPESK